MMKMNTKNLGMLVLLTVLVIGVVLISGCAKGPEKGPAVTTPSVEEPAEKPTGEQNDANSGGDVSAELESPYSVGYGEWNGTLTGDDDGDAYGVRWNPGDIIDIVVSPSKGLDIAFYGMAGGFTIERRNAGVEDEPESIQITADITDDIKRADILISAISGSGDYTLNITATPQNDGNSGKDAPEYEEKMQPPLVSAGKFEGCYLGSKDWEDRYAIKLNEKQTATVVAIPSKELDVELNYVVPDWRWTDAYVNDNFRGESEELTIKADTTGNYLIAVNLVGETKGRYTLEITTK